MQFISPFRLCVFQQNYMNSILISFLYDSYLLITGHSRSSFSHWNTLKGVFTHQLDTAPQFIVLHHKQNKGNKTEVCAVAMSLLPHNFLSLVQEKDYFMCDSTEQHLVSLWHWGSLKLQFLSTAYKWYSVVILLKGCITQEFVEYKMSQTWNHLALHYLLLRSA